MRTLGLGIGLIAVAAAALGLTFARDLRAAAARLEGRSHVIETAHGPLEYALAGQGAPVLVIHGTGGGFDQGLAFSVGLARRGHQVIAPSRFGYLRSGYPRDPSSEAQADAYVTLLDQLGLDKVAVIGASAGALSAAQFALRHPERCQAVVLVVPAANVSGADPVRMSALQAFLVSRMASSDLLFWTLTKVARDTLLKTLLATDPAVIRAAQASERRRASRMLAEILPISRRTRGMLNDGRLAGAPAGIDFGRIAAPLLLVSAEDDRFGTAQTARMLAQLRPGAELLIFPDGGHVLIGREAALWDRVSGFLSEAGGAGQAAVQGSITSGKRPPC